MLLLSTSSLKGYGLHKIFSIAKKANFDGINLDVFSGDFDSENPEYIKELSDLFQIPVVSITAYEKKMDKNEVDNFIKMSELIGAKIINFYPPYRTDKDTTWFSNYLTAIKDKNKDTTLSIINVEPKTFLFIIPEYKDATLDTIKKVSGNTTLSVSNVDSSTGIDLLKTYSKLGNSIRNVFLSDKSGTKQEVMIGKGEMPLESLLIKLKENGYNGFFTLKISPKELSVGKDDMVLKKLEEAKKYFYKYF